MNEKLYCVKFYDNSADPDLANEMLNALDLDFSSWHDLEQNQVVYTVYATDPATAQKNLDSIRTTAVDWKQLGLTIDNIEYIEINKEDWSESWKKYFSFIPISDSLMIKPSWLEYQPKPGQKVLEIDPGMSFGTGQHATTLFCLKMIDKLAGNPEVHSLLDAGCGSGILTIAGALLGYGPIDSFDNDPEAVMIAEQNLMLNHITSVKPEVGDAAVYTGRPEKYDLVCANILGHLLIAFRHNISKWIRPGGYLALAGILNQEFDELSKIYIELGFKELERETLKEWTSGLFQKID